MFVKFIWVFLFEVAVLGWEKAIHSSPFFNELPPFKLGILVVLCLSCMLIENDGEELRLESNEDLLWLFYSVNGFLSYDSLFSSKTYDFISQVCMHEVTFLSDVCWFRISLNSFCLDLSFCSSLIDWLCLIFSLSFDVVS